MLSQIKHPVYRAHVLNQISDDMYKARALAGPLLGQEVLVLFLGDQKEVLGNDIIVRSNSAALGLENNYITNEPRDFLWADSSSVLFAGMWYGPKMNSLEDVAKVYYPGTMTSALYVTAEEGILKTYEVLSDRINPYKSPNVEHERHIVSSFIRYWKNFPGDGMKFMESSRVILFSGSLNEGFKENKEMYNQINQALFKTPLFISKHSTYGLRQFHIPLKPAGNAS